MFLLKTSVFLFKSVCLSNNSSCSILQLFKPLGNRLNPAPGSSRRPDSTPGSRFSFETLQFSSVGQFYNCLNRLGTTRIQLQEAPGGQTPLLEAGSHLNPIQSVQFSFLELDSSGSRPKADRNFIRILARVARPKDDRHFI